MVCDSELSSQLKSAAYSALRKMAGDIQDETPALMSGVGHDAMAVTTQGKALATSALYLKRTSHY